MKENIGVRAIEREDGMMEFEFVPAESASMASRTACALMDMNADAWEVIYTNKDGIQRELYHNPVNALIVCEQLHGAEPPMEARLRPLSYKKA